MSQTIIITDDLIAAGGERALVPHNARPSSAARESFSYPFVKVYALLPRDA
jgi:hypothetical protein